MLNEEQKNAVDELMHFVFSNERYAILTGPAGTGKSYTIYSVLEEYFKLVEINKLISPNDPLKLWYLTATTNKAKQALQQEFPNGEVTTIHSLLGLSVYKGNLVKRRVANLHESRPSIVVIDECSYIDNKLLEHIEELPKHVKVIFIGDQYQLAPVRITNPPIFFKGIPTVQLTKSMRQLNSPDIADVSKGFMEYIRSNGEIDFPKVSLSQNITHVSREEFEAITQDVFINQRLSTKDHRILSYSNKVVQKHNNRLFALANGRNDFQVGDIILNNHYVQRLATDDQVRVAGRNDFISSIPDCNGYQFELGNGITLVTVISPFNYKKALKSVNTILEDTTIAGANKKEAMNLYERIADLRPLYACTVHKSQGSTYQVAYIDLDSFKYMRDPVAMARLLYVAISRASHKVFLTGDVV